MVLSMLNLEIISHERTKSRFVADYSLLFPCFFSIKKLKFARKT